MLSVHSVQCAMVHLRAFALLILIQPALLGSSTDCQVFLARRAAQHVKLKLYSELFLTICRYIYIYISI